MELFHVINRGVDGRKIFHDDQDRARFVHDLYEFNDTAPAQEFLASDASNMSGRTTSRHRDRIVDIHGWKLVGNHFHLIMSERVERGLSLFLSKLSGYARYFNERHGRRGVLFQGRTKRVPIETDAHFLYILHYIHLNALDELPGFKLWRERDKGNIGNAQRAMEHLRADRWSSFRDYCGIKNFPSILTKSLFEESPGEYEKTLRAYLRERAFEQLEPQELE